MKILKKPLFWIILGILLLTTAFSIYAILFWSNTISLFTIFLIDAVFLLLALLSFIFIRKFFKQSPQDNSEQESNVPSSLVADKINEAFDNYLNLPWITKLPKRKRLHALPYYLLIGKSGCGKTTSLKYSGLDFNLPGENHLPATQNVDFYFSEKGVFIELAGKYVENHEYEQEYNEIIDTLILRRRGKAPQAIIYCVEANNEVNETDLSEQALILKKRLQYITDKCGIKVIIHLLVTRSDKIDGFTAFFNHFSSEKEMGLTLKDDDPDYLKDTLHKLYRIIDTKRLKAVSLSNPLNLKQQVYQFPFNFKMAVNHLITYIMKVFFESGIKNEIYLSSLYFCAVPDSGGGAVTKTNQEISKSYFTNSFYNQHLKKETSFEIQNVKAYLIKTYLKPFLASLILSILTISCIISYNNYKTALNTFLYTLYNTPKSVNELQSIRNNSDNIGNCFFYWISPGSQKVYHAVNQYFLNKSKTLIGRRLKENLEDNMNSNYNALRTYILLSDSMKFLDDDPEFLIGFFTNNSTGLPETSAKIMTGVAEIIDDHDYLNLQSFFKNEPLKILKAQQTHSGNNISLMYAQLENGIKEAGISFNQLFPPEVTAVYSSEFILNPLYTPQVYKSYVTNKIKKLDSSPLTAKRVLGKFYKSNPDKDLESELQKLYFHKYIEEWNRLLRSIQLVKNRDYKNAVAIIEKMAEADFSYNPQKLLIDVIAQNTRFDNIIIDQAKSVLGESINENPVDKRYKVFHQLHNDENGSFTELVNIYAGLLDYYGEVDLNNRAFFLDESKNLFASSQIDQAMKEIRKKMRKIEPVLKKEIFESPIICLGHAILNQTQYAINQQWVDILKDLRSDIQKYPFKRQSTENISYSTLYRYLNKNDGRIAEFENLLKPYIRSSYNDPLKWEGKALTFSQSFIRFIDKIHKISEGLGLDKNAQPSLHFFLKPELSSGRAQNTVLVKMIFNIAGESWTYDMGPQREISFSWPSSDGNMEVSFEFVTHEGSRQPFSETDEWALFRLFDKARIDRSGNNSQLISWTFPDYLNREINFTFRYKYMDEISLLTTDRSLFDLTIPEQVN